MRGQAADVLTKRLPEVPDLVDLHQRSHDRLPFLLHTVQIGSRHNRYSMALGVSSPAPQIVHSGIRDGGAFLRRLQQAYRAEAVPAAASGLPFIGGWFLYLGYELAIDIEPVLAGPVREGEVPWAAAWRCDAAVIVDHHAGTASVVAESRAGLDEIVALVRESADAAAVHDAPYDWEIDSEPGAEFCAGVERIKAYIAAGDVFQVNLSRGWRARALGGDTGQLPWQIYRQLCRRNPAPYSGMAAMFGGTLISASPERLVLVEGNRVTTRPIAGTRPRGSDRARDRDLYRELIRNPKERAEHIMLIDLERNDLGRVCRPGSVAVSELMVRESYASVHHIVSNVVGELRPGLSPVDAIPAVFPGGTITGCPKVRCMQIIAELEQQPRGFYTGSMGYLSRHGRMDLNILIRSLWHRGDRLAWRCGSGIVADSEPDQELAETEAKAAGIVWSLQPGNTR